MSSAAQNDQANEFAFNIHKCVELAYQSSESIEECFKHLKCEFEQKNGFEKFFSYFQQTFIDPTAIFPIDFWNIHDSLADSLKMADDVKYWRDYFQKIFNGECCTKLNVFIQKLQEF
ncbi:unnamed protein product [Didymodactylos carnosus]|uniref:Uncharacterized protein n=1 Tax=Didymodactylos carnosus TaxID=1234261 RepID=A0A816BQP9_9BILA|nr:unnamed protein product [Didymodactylos carnosus]CAF1612219.1 unnamed protein product [Didymodactylos carnosus]CAF3873020.1 unnamed protein product [Didymodactylos carnosus]CAF4495970.1 unnamed protein product [Didymodactylos carnosus]